MNTYSAIRCPSCGSKNVVPTEGRFYCKSCDGFFEKATPTLTVASKPQDVEKSNSLLFLACTTIVPLFLLVLTVAWVASAFSN